MERHIIKKSYTCLFTFLMAIIVFTCLSRETDAKADELIWLDNLKYSFKVNGKKQEPWVYHVEKDLRYSNSNVDKKLFYIDGKYITIDPELERNLYIGTKKLNPQYMAQKELSDYLFSSHKEQMEKGLEEYSLIYEDNTGAEFDEEEKRKLLEEYSEYKDDYYFLLTNYCKVNDWNKIITEVKECTEQTEDHCFWVPASNKEQTLKIDITLNGKAVKDDKYYYYVTEVYGKGPIILSSFGEPIGADNNDTTFDYSDGAIKIPKNWTGLIQVRFFRLERGYTTTYDFVDEYIYVSNDVSITSEAVFLYEGQSEQIQLTGKVKNISYKVADTKVAEVDKTGLITGKNAGNTTVTLYKNKKEFAIINVTVNTPHMIPSRLMLGVNEKQKLYFSGADIKIKSVSSSNKKVAKISKKGVITAKKKGTATITVTDTNNIKYVCKVYVSKSKDELQEEILESSEYKAHPVHSVWDGNSKYSAWKGGSVNPGTNGDCGYAAMISDIIMGDAKAYYYDDPYGLLPGDIVFVKNGNGSHAVTIIGVDYSPARYGEIRYQVLHGYVYNHDRSYAGVVVNECYLDNDGNFSLLITWDNSYAYPIYGIDKIISRYK